jgi:hypothetical protein
MSRMASLSFPLYVGQRTTPPVAVQSSKKYVLCSDNQPTIRTGRMQRDKLLEVHGRAVGNPDQRRTMAKTTTDSQLRGLCYRPTDYVHLRGINGTYN